MKIPQPFWDPGVIFVLHLSKQVQEMASFIHLFIHLYVCSLTTYGESAKCQALQLTRAPYPVLVEQKFKFQATCL